MRFGGWGRGSIGGGRDEGEMSEGGRDGEMVMIMFMFMSHVFMFWGFSFGVYGVFGLI